MHDRTSELVALARRVDEKSFAKRSPGIFLVVSLDLGERISSAPRTTVRMARPGDQPPRVPRGFVVIDVVRRESSPFADMVSVGRTDANDIVLPHPTVSKLHATFSKTGEEAWMLTDQDSTNGTWIAGQRLVAHEPRPLRGEEAIAFGECHAEIKSSRALWRFLELVRRSA